MINKQSAKKRLEEIMERAFGAMWESKAIGDVVDDILKEIDKAYKKGKAEGFIQCANLAPKDLIDKAVEETLNYLCDRGRIGKDEIPKFLNKLKPKQDK